MTRASYIPTDPHLRCSFECPLIAATVEEGVHSPEQKSWVYTPLSGVEEARSWVNETVYYSRDSVEPAAFLQSVTDNVIPYILADGSEQYLRIFVTSPDSTLNTFCIFLHASHAVTDAKPGLLAISLLLEWMSTPCTVNVADLPWGTEHRNLPPGPITVTGGPRDDWNKHGSVLMQKVGAFFANQTVRPCCYVAPPGSLILIPCPSLTAKPYLSISRTRYQSSGEAATLPCHLHGTRVRKDHAGAEDI